MKTREELQAIIKEIASDKSPVGMDPVYVHALILDKLTDIQRRLTALEEQRVEEVEGAESRSD
jgi:hypothetical protein